MSFSIELPAGEVASSLREGFHASVRMASSLREKFNAPTPRRSVLYCRAPQWKKTIPT